MPWDTDTGSIGKTFLASRILYSAGYEKSYSSMVVIGTCIIASPAAPSQVQMLISGIKSGRTM